VIRTSRWALFLCVLAAFAAQPSQAMTQTVWRLSVETMCPGHFEGIAYYRTSVWRYERRMGKRPTRPTYGEHAVGSCEQVAQFVVRWRKLANTRYQQLLAYVKRNALARPAHYSAWLCIHSYEGAWNDSGDPYWGGLQMDRGFMATYGSDMIRRYHGFANVWPPLAQMVVAERAFASGRGFSPWPNTARYCGLL
jgi:hypothetical protein